MGIIGRYFLPSERGLVHLHGLLSPSRRRQPAGTAAPAESVAMAPRDEVPCVNVEAAPAARDPAFREVLPRRRWHLRSASARGRKESAGSAARPPRWSRSRARAQELSRGGACGAPRPPDLLQWKMAPRGEHTQTRWRCRTKKHFPQDNDSQDRHGKIRGLSMSASQVRHEHNVNAVVRNRRGQLHFQGRGARMPHGEHFPPGRKAARKEVEEEPARAVLSKHAHGLPPFRAPGGRVRRRFGAPPGRHRRR